MTFKKHTSKPRRDVYAEVTDAIVKQIEDGLNGSWKRPWVSSGVGAGLPHSIEGRAYRGLNVILLMSAAARQGCASNTWGTYKAWQGIGAQVRKGEKAQMVTLWKRNTWTKTNEETGEDEECSGLFVRAFHVFAAEQVEGFDLEGHLAKQKAKLPCLAERLENVEGAIAAYRAHHGIGYAEGGDRAFYAPGPDRIQMPPHEAFRSTEEFYGTLLHEAGHSTGHKRRLDRQFGARFGDNAYAFEELVAELTAAMTCAAFGVEQGAPREDHAQYVASWLRALKNDKRAIFTAASKAQQASDMIMEFAGEAQGDDEGITTELKEAA